MYQGEQGSYARYTTVAIVLHWAIAAAIIALLAMGVWAAEALKAEDQQTQFLAFQTIQIHKALGLTVLALTLLRIVWRLWRPAPPHPVDMPGWQKAASGASHLLLYAFMLGAPLTGWLMSSASPELKSLPTTWFGLFNVPHLPLLGFDDAWLAAISRNAHAVIAGLGALLLILHVAAALKHHYVDKDAVLARMTPGVRPLRPVYEPPAPAANGLARLAGAGVLTASLVGALFLFAPNLLAPPLSPAPVADQVAVAAPMAAPEDRAAPTPRAQGAPLWTVDTDGSQIGFTGTHLGSEFTGVFERWRADIRFDPNDLAGSEVRVAIETGSARTGDVQYDGALPETDWFDATAHPEAVFVSHSFSPADGDDADYVASGELTIKGLAHPVQLPFTLEIDGDAAVMRGALTLDRLALGLGLAADATAAWVGQEVMVALEVSATRATAEPPSAIAAAPGPLWRVAAEQSEIGFTGTHLGSEFTGVFERWRADIRFDPNDLAGSEVRVAIETASARTGDVQYDGALPEADWFDAAGHPEAVFVSQSFTKADGDGQADGEDYVASGELTIKGQAHPVELPFSLEIDGDAAVMRGALTLDRLALGLGLAADATAAWVGQEVVVSLTVTAARQGSGDSAGPDQEARLR
ncbi:MAG: YceI family protein [Pseudomonadota bacterium]